MKKLLLLLLALAYFSPTLIAQTCDCGKVKFSITNWICKGKNAAGDPVYEGTFTIENNTNCKFTLTEMLQQTAGDVSVPLPISVAPGGTYSTTIIYTDVPPYSPPGSTPYFIVVYNLDDIKCKFEFPSDKIPTCDDSCTCSDDGWLTFVATIGGVSQKVECGHQFGLSCKDTIEMKGEYLCKGSCTAKYSAVLVDALTNTVIQSYPSFSFPWMHQFTANGSYYLEITPICGDTKCKPCRFYFTVTNCTDNCGCNPDGWSPFTATLAGITQTVECGHQFGLTCKDTINLKGEYKCLGDCHTKYSAVLVDAITNTVVQSYPNFSFPWIYQFPGPGSYYIEITPICGTKKCQPCRFFFTVKDCPTTCDCNPDGWQPFTATLAGITQIVECGHQFGLTCKDTINLKGEYKCLGDCHTKYSAVLIDAITNTVIQTYPNFSFPWIYQFPGPGSYYIEITPICGTKKCQPCRFFFTVKDCPTTCECNPDGWQPFTATLAGITQTVECGHQFGLTCKDTINLKGEYKCLGDCHTKYSAVLVDAITNTVVQSYPNFSFPWIYQFPGPGSYYLEITPICGTKKCQPCRFYFTVRDCPTTCDCNPNGWQRFTAYINNDSLTVTCGYQFGTYLKSIVRIYGNYLCLGNCAAKYVAVLRDNITGAIIQTWSPLVFPWNYTFTAEGNYKLEIIPICGDKKCTPCVFYFTVKKPII